MVACVSKVVDFLVTLHLTILSQIPVIYVYDSGVTLRKLWGGQLSHNINIIPLNKKMRHIVLTFDC